MHSVVSTCSEVGKTWLQVCEEGQTWGSNGPLLSFVHSYKGQLGGSDSKSTWIRLVVTWLAIGWQVISLELYLSSLPEETSHMLPSRTPCIKFQTNSPLSPLAQTNSLPSLYLLPLKYDGIYSIGAKVCSTLLTEISPAPRIVSATE